MSRPSAKKPSPEVRRDEPLLSPTEHRIPAIGMVSARVEYLERVRRYGLGRVEMVQFRCSEAEVRQIVAEEWPVFSAHCPLLFPDWYPDWPLTAALVDLDAERRESTKRLIRETMALASDLGAQYATVHADRPVLLLGEASAQSADEASGLQLAREGCEWLQRQAERYGLPVHIENMIANPLFWSAEHYLGAVRDLPDVQVCLDVGHLALNAAKFGFSLMEWVAAVAPQIASAHLYNNQFRDDFEFHELREGELLRKLPVHPTQSPGQGWLDVRAILEIVLAARPDCYLNHEIYASLDTDPDLTREGIAWVQQIRDDCVGAQLTA